MSRQLIGRPAKLNEKKGDRDLERDIKKQRRQFLLEEQHENYVAAVTKWNKNKISSHDLHNVYVVVQFYPWFKFYLPLFLGMVMYDNEFETKENKI